jgi:hypothetical protein
VDVPTDKLWGAQTQRSLEHFSIEKDLIPRDTVDIEVADGKERLSFRRFRKGRFV